MIKHIFKLIWNKKQANALIILEILVAFLILCAVLVFVIYNMQRYREPLGYNTQNVWVAHLGWPPGTDSTAIADTKALLLDEISNLPGVQKASFCMSATFPLGGGVWTMSSSKKNGPEYSTHYIEAGPEFADVMGLNLIEGRWFAESDLDAKYLPVVINKKLRDFLFADTIALGQILDFSGERKVVGVIDHLKYYGEFGEEPNIVIVDYPKGSTQDPILAMKMAPGIEPAFEEELNKIIRRVTKDWNFTITNYESRRIAKSQETWIPLIALICIAVFLILNVALGLFGVLWQNIQRRRAEVGLRQAMGATRRKIYSQFILEMIFVTTLGVALGLIFTLQFPLLKVIDIENQIYFLAMLSAALLIYTLVLVCSFYPSRQASLIQPAIALHEE